ncbi:TLC domain-containing protein 3A isoform X2 [Toxorhynchites rutilus septentrionalis]|uniref:TLC domain-containing protein 3A isoform X2 n=1 Tax=Toxorhynchites rutilus septentrionalis TaxID=329112 RepID=UPI0024783C1A|nr:TLC domain-containing protein 3A isoform X2 [Toxorhynchites rutilus septentrionalis]
MSANTKTDTKGCLFALLYSVGSFGLACASLWDLKSDDRITVQKGALLITLGFVYFITLTELLNKLILQTSLGLNLVKRYRLRISDVLDISNKIVSAVQATFSCVAGFFVCRWSCPRNFLQASHFLSESYAWFAASYFIYDIWSMYKVYAAETSNRIMVKLGLSSDGTAKSGKVSNDTVVDSANEDAQTQPFSDIPSISNGTLSFLLPSKKGVPTFARYIINHKLMVFHHLFIGSYGLAVIAFLRGGLGDCVFGFMYMMELSTPFVSFRGILSIMGLKESRVYVANGLLMLFTFFWCRVFLMPYVCYYYSQVVNLPFFERTNGWKLEIFGNNRR